MSIKILEDFDILKPEFQFQHKLPQAKDFEYFKNLIKKREVQNLRSPKPAGFHKRVLRFSLSIANKYIEPKFPFNLFLSSPKKKHSFIEINQRSGRRFLIEEDKNLFVHHEDFGYYGVYKDRSGGYFFYSGTKAYAKQILDQYNEFMNL